jgi:uncharacterized membrane protein YphA (DoxX/SURF4 family)
MVYLNRVIAVWGRPNRRDHSSDGLLAVYNVANQRYMSNTTLQWQIPLYGIPAQAALFVGIATTTGAISVALGGVALLIGFVGAVVMRRIELTARWDRQTLDEFEQLLLPRGSSLSLMHDAPFKARLRKKRLLSSASFLKRIELRLMRLAPPSLALMVLLILVGTGASVLGMTRLHGGSSSPHPGSRHELVKKVSNITL